MLHHDVSETGHLSARLVRFSSFEVDFELSELRKDGVRVPLQHKPFRILELLLKYPGSLVTRAELAKDLWPHLPLSFERSLNTAVNALRQALDDSPRESLFIETRSGLGYRFVGEVEEIGEPRSTRSPSNVSDKSGDSHLDCLKGRYFLNRVTGESLQRAIGCFQSALGHDIHYAPAWAGLAYSYSRLALSGTVAASELSHKARDSAREAVTADANLAAAHVSLGFVRMVFDGDWKGAETDLARAIDLDIDLADGHRIRALLLTVSGRYEEALEEGRRAQALEPLSLPVGLDLARILYLSRDFDGTVRECWNLLSLEPRFWPAQSFLGLACARLGLPDEAVTELENACVCSDRHPAAVCALGCVAASLGMQEQAELALRELDPQAAGVYTSWYWRAAIHAWRGEPIPALESLVTACAHRDPLLLWLGVDPGFDLLRTHSRFAALLDRLGLACLQRFTVPGSQP
jgi:DNA-binding winged helix-turn-helix (wHTH) protein